MAQVIADALHAGVDDPGTVARAIGPLSAPFGLPPGNGPGLLEWLLDLTAVPEREAWLDEARSSAGQMPADEEDRQQ